MIDSKTTQHIRILIMITLLSGILFFLLKLPIILSDLQQSIPFTTSENCDLKKTKCIAVKGDRSISLEIIPKNIGSLVPLTFSVTLHNIEAQSILLDIQGKEMYMGINQIKLSPASGKNNWIGTTELAICTTGMMTWNASVLAYSDQSAEPDIATFEFESK